MDAEDIEGTLKTVESVEHTNQGIKPSRSHRAEK